MVCISLAYANFFCINEDIFFEKKAIGWLSWLRTDPMPVSDMSISNMKGLEKLGNAKTGAWVSTCCNMRNVSSAALDHLKESFF